MERYEKALEKFEENGGTLGDWGHSTVYLVQSEQQMDLAKKCVAYGKTSDYLIERQGLPKVYGWYEGPGWYRAVAHNIQSWDEREIERYEYTMEMMAPYIVARKEL